MTKEEYDVTVQHILNKTDEYQFLKDNKELENIIVLGLGGSYAYGINNEDSDLDLRGIAFNSKRNILLQKDFENCINTAVDCTIYSFEKIISLFCACNPNVIELFGLKNEHYLVKNDAFLEILAHKSMFLSTVAAHSFGGYANAQLRRLQNKSARLATQTEHEENILKSIEHASYDYQRRFFSYDEDAIKMYIDKSDKSELESEIFMDLNLRHYPLRDFRGMMNDMQNIIKNYDKVGRRNSRAIEHDKLGKHMCHLVRLYYMGLDILEKGEINTYRDKEHDLLMDIRNGLYLDENRQVLPEFYDLVDELEKRLIYARENTSLPDKVNMKEVEDFIVYMNTKYVMEREA